MIPPADRRWQYRDAEGTWEDVARLNPSHLLLSNGQAIAWARDGGSLPQPDMQGRLRYTVPVNGQWMEWRVAGRSGLAVLALDSGRPELAAAIREAQAEERQRHATQH